MATIRVHKLEKVGKQRLPDGPLTIGRSMKNDMCLPHPSVSRRHCVIETIDGTTRVRDLDSRHGTTLNGKAVDEATLHHGDVIGVGIFEITFADAHAPADEHEGDDHEFDLVMSPDESSAHGTALDGSSTGSVAALAPAGSDRDAAHADARHAAEMNELRDQVADLKRELEERRAELKRTTGASASAREALEEKDAEIEQSRTELERTRGELDQARTALREKEAQLRENEAQLREARDEIESSSESRREEIEALRGELETIRQSAETERARAAEFEAKLSAQTAESLEQLKGIEHTRAEYDDRLKTLEAERDDMKSRAEKAARDLDLRSEKLDAAAAKIAELREAIKTLKARAGELAGRAHEVDQFLSDLRTTARQVMTVLQQLSNVRRNVQTLESAYVQANEYVDDAETFDSDNHEDMIAQREAVGEQLETAHGQLEQTITDLYQATAQLCQFVLAQPVKASLEAGAASTKRGFFSRLVKQ